MTGKGARKWSDGQLERVGGLDSRETLCDSRVSRSLASLAGGKGESTGAVGSANSLRRRTPLHTPPDLLFRIRTHPMYDDIELDEGGVARVQSAVGRKWQHLMDLSAPHTGPRWALSALFITLYCIRVYLINGKQQQHTRNNQTRTQRRPSHLTFHTQAGTLSRTDWESTCSTSSSASSLLKSTLSRRGRPCLPLKTMNFVPLSEGTYRRLPTLINVP